MRADLYGEMASVEDGHWWFRGRRAIIRHVLNKANIAPGSAILDAGSGTGGNLSMLSQFGKVYAVEMEDEARAFANRRGVVQVEAGMLPGAIPFGAQTFDLAVLFDVLEHVEQDYETLVALHNRLNAGGKLLITVPAFQFLWSEHDVIHHHKRRYALGALTRLVERAGYKVVFSSYINFWLFPLIAGLRLLDRLTFGKLMGKKHGANAELHMPSASVNRLLEGVFASERRLMDIMRLPFGVSIVLLAQKK